MADDDPLSQALAAIQTPEGRAFLDTLAGPESGGRYNVRFDGSPTGATFDDYSQHPRVRAVIPNGWPMAGSSSDAAGAFQLLSSTADAAAQRLGLPGAEQKQYSFDPLSQRLLAWNNATEAYKQARPNGNMLADLQNGNVDQVMGAMRSTRQWDTANSRAYAGNLARNAQTAQAGTPDAPGGQVAGMGAGLDPWDMAFIKGTLKFPDQPQSGGAANDAATPQEQAPIPPQPAPPSGVAALAAAGRSPTELTGSPASIPIPTQGSGVAALAAAGQPPATLPANQLPPANAFGGPSVIQSQIDRIDAQMQAIASLPPDQISQMTAQAAQELAKTRADLVKQLPVAGYQQKTAENLGSKEQGVNQAGAVVPLEGALPAAQATAQATAEGEQIPARVTQAVAPRELRGAGASIYFPPGSPIAQQYQNKSGDAVPSNVEIDPQGGVTVANMNPASETIGKNFEALKTMETAAESARQTQYQAALLKDRLNAIGTSGPLTTKLGELGALARQVGVKPDVLKAINIPDAPTVEQANAISLELLGSILRQTFPQRVTNTDISTFRPSNPNVNMLSDASNYLLDRIVLPKAQRDIERYGAAVALPQNDPQSFMRGLYDWDQANPYQKYVSPETGSPPTQGVATSMPSGLPPGSKQIGTKNGVPVWQTPDNKRFTVQ